MLNGFARMGVRFQDFHQRTLDFLSIIESDWNVVKRIHELYTISNFTFLKKEASKVLDDKKHFPMNTQVEIVEGVHMINKMFFSPLITASNTYEKINSLIANEFKIFNQSNKENFTELLEYFSNDFKRYEAKLYSLTEKFIGIFKYLIPIFGIKFYNNSLTSQDKEIYGVTTMSFEDLKGYYVDAYETLIDLSDLIVACNNLKYRNSYEKMNLLKGFEKINSLDNYKLTMKNKGNKLNFLSSSEIFNQLMSKSLDNDIRNAIGHFTYQVNNDSQIISFLDLKGSVKKELYLLDFSQHCFNLFDSTINLIELIYQMKRYYYIEKYEEYKKQKVYAKRKITTKKIKNNRKISKKSQKKNRKN